MPPTIRDLSQPTDSASDLCADGMLGLDEAAAFAGLSRQGIYRRMWAGELAFVKLGKRRLVPRRALMQMLAKNLHDPNDAK